MNKEDFNLLNNKEVIRWCYEPITKVSLVNSSNAIELKKLIISKKIGLVL